MWYKVTVLAPADVVVVGASFAGLACARAAAARGLRVVVLERKPDPGAAPRTTGLLVKEAAEEISVPPSLTRTIGGVRLYSPSLASVDLDRPGYYFLATDVPGLLRRLAADAAACGAEVLCGTPYAGARLDGDGVRLDPPGIRARFLVGADGARSRVARDFGLGENRDFLVGVEAEYEGVRDLAEDRLHVFLDSELAPGYIAWVVPGVGITQVGLAARVPARPQLEPLLRRVGRLCDLSRARLVARRGGPIPVGGPVRPSAHGPVLLAGDAAGWASPLTAGGIHHALRLGRRAGLAIADHALARGPEPAVALAAELPRFRWKLLLRRSLDLRPPNAVLDAALGSRAFRAFARAVFFHSRGLLSPAAWGNIVRDLAARRAPA